MTESARPDEEHVETLNYSAHAIDDLDRLKKGFAAVDSRDGRCVELIQGLLRSAVKFLLPNCADLLEMKDLRQAHLDLVRMPFPVTVLEIPWRSDEARVLREAVTQTLSTRRIVLCIERSALPPEFAERVNAARPADEDGVLVISIPWFDEIGMWGLMDGAAFIPYGAQVRVAPTTEIGPASRREALQKAGMLPARKRSSTFDGEMVILFDQLFVNRTNAEGLEEAWGSVWADQFDPVTAVVKFTNVVNCANVGQAIVAAPTKLNRKRAAGGKTAFFEYRVLELDATRPGDARGALGNTRESPRMHLRRGHIRRLETRSVWVRAAVVSNPERGVVDHDYRLNPVKLPRA